MAPTLDPVSIQRLVTFADERGLLLEPWEQGAAPPAGCHLAITRPGHTRGNHAHEHRTEMLVVVGPARVQLGRGTGQRRHDVAAGQAVRFRIPPGVHHAVTNTGTEPSVLLAWHQDAGPRADLNEQRKRTDP